MVGRRLLAHFIVGLMVGGLASLTISLNLLLAVSAVLLLVVVGLATPRFALLAGGLLGIGLSWSILMVRQAAICEATAQVHCGFANFLPLITIAVALSAAGLLFAALSLRRLAREGRLAREQTVTGSRPRRAAAPALPEQAVGLGCSA